MFSFVFGFISGTALGIYLSQNYQVPNMKDLVENFKSSAKKFEKKPDEDTKKDS